MDSPGRQRLDFRNYHRRYGVEIEVNALDGRSKPDGETPPQGIHYAGLLVNRALGCPVEVCKWHATHNNNAWVIKPDSSCGMELCSPVCKGVHGLGQIRKVIEAVRDDPLLTADDRCSLHLHVEVADMSRDELAAVLTWWVKCEYVFLCSVPPCRKRNRYCQQLGITDLFEHDSSMTPTQLINRLGNYKYFSVNTYHYGKGKRPTVEFRILEAAACQDPDLTCHWAMLVLHFVEMARNRGMPPPFEPGNQWSSFLWLTPREVFDVLGFLPGEYELSEDMASVRDWLLRRLLANTAGTGLPGVWSEQAMRPLHAEAVGLGRDIAKLTDRSDI